MTLNIVAVTLGMVTLGDFNKNVQCPGVTLTKTYFSLWINGELR